MIKLYRILHSWKKNIEDHEIEVLDFYPLKGESDWIYLTLGCKNPTDWYVLHGKIQENDEDKFLLGVDLTYNIGGAEEEYYFLYDNSHHQGVIFEQPILKMLSAIERIQAKNQLTLEGSSAN